MQENPTTIEDINAILRTLDVIEPLPFDEPEAKQMHLAALALMYKDKAFRDYLTESYNSALKSAALKSTNEIDMAFGKARALTLKEIFIKSKRAFETLDKINKEKLRSEQSKESNEGI